MEDCLIECVPNISEGRDSDVIEKAASAIRSTQGCTLLGVDPGASTNRTVLTFVGSPTAVVEGALSLARCVQREIDMRKHTGEHPRMGAIDVCPFIPLPKTKNADYLREPDEKREKGEEEGDVQMALAVRCAKDFASRAAEELNISSFLYGHAAEGNGEHRRSLPQVRSGEYEGLEERLLHPEWLPDYGPACFNPRFGMMAIGSRSLLIAYNVNILGTKEQAHRIALDVREAGRTGNDGELKSVKGIGWYVDEYKLAQVSLNLTDLKQCDLHEAFEACSRRAAALKHPVMGSEAVGLLPLSSLLNAAHFYMERDGLLLLEEEDKIRFAIQKMGLASISSFDPEKRIIEYAMQSPESQMKESPLLLSSFSSLIDKLGSRTASPGGGSAAAAIGATGAALGKMVAFMSYGSRRWEKHDELMRTCLRIIHEAMKELKKLIDADSAAYDQYRSALRLPKGPATFDALLQCIRTPLEIMACIDALWEPVEAIAPYFNLNCKSDFEIATRALELGSWGAHRNVIINAEDALLDEHDVSKVLALKYVEMASSFSKRSTQMSQSILASIDARET